MHVQSASAFLAYECMVYGMGAISYLIAALALAQACLYHIPQTAQCR